MKVTCKHVVIHVFKAVPTAVVVGKVGEASSFEVTVNNILISSKLDSLEFPDHDHVLAVVKNADAGRMPVGITRSSSTCNLL